MRREEEWDDFVREGDGERAIAFWDWVESGSGVLRRYINWRWRVTVGSTCTAYPALTGEVSSYPTQESQLCLARDTSQNGYLSEFNSLLLRVRQSERVSVSSEVAGKG